MKILVVIMKYDYGVKERGYSFEYINVYKPLCDVYGEENVILYDFLSDYKEKGKKFTNNRIIELCKELKPGISLFCMFKDQIETGTVDRLRNYSPALCYFTDDPWRVEFAHKWIKHFDFFSTPDYFMYKTYLSEGINNALYSPFGFNSNIYIKKDLPKKYDVTFVGGFSPYRKWIIHLLKKEGINIKVFGRGWGSGSDWVSQEEMVDIFNQSRINLNLSNAISFDYKFLLYSLSSPYAVAKILRLKKFREQVKGRHYEINGCGGFQLSYYVQSLNLAYEIEKEIAVFDSVYNLPDTIKFYLKNEETAEQIAGNGYQRSLKDHSAQSYLKRLIESTQN